MITMMTTTVTMTVKSSGCFAQPPYFSHVVMRGETNKSNPYYFNIRVKFHVFSADYGVRGHCEKMFLNLSVT